MTVVGSQATELEFLDSLRKQELIHFIIDPFITLISQYLNTLSKEYNNHTGSEKVTHFNLQFSLSRLWMHAIMKYLRLFLEVFLRVRKCAYICMKGECFSIKFFGDVCFIGFQRRKAWSSVHQGVCAAFGNFVTHWCLLVQHTQSVQDQWQLKNSEENRNSKEA